MFSVLNVSGEKISDKAVKGVEERVTSVYSQRGVSFQELYEAILHGMTEYRECEFGVTSGSENKRARELARTYASDDWNFSR
jgi:lipoate-protein ligase A